MGARCRRREAWEGRRDGSTSRRRLNSFRIPLATTVRGHPMWNIKREVRRGFRRGFTLAEGLVAAVVLAEAGGGRIAAMSASDEQTQTGQQTRIPISMGQQLMEKNLSKPFAEPSVFDTT